MKRKKSKKECKKRYIYKKEFDTNDKKNYKVRHHCHYTGKYRGAAHNICNLRYKIPKEIPIVFHNVSTYDYHFIIKELVKEFDRNFGCLAENTEKCITFSVSLKKKIENKNIEITYKIKFIDSFRCMSSSLSKLVDNLSEGLHNNKALDCESCLDYIKTKNEKLILKCFNFKQSYEKDFNKELIQRLTSTYEFCNQNLNKFILLLRKGVYPYEYMDNWERFNKTSLPNKESFYSNLNMENIDDIDYRHGNNVFKRFKLKNLGEYHDLYVQSNMSQKLPVNGFKWINDVSEINEEFIKNYDENNDKGYILEVDVKYPRKVNDIHSDLPFLPKRMKIDKCKKLVCNLLNKKKYVVHIKSLKQTLNHGLKFKKVHRITEFNQKAWFKPYIDMNTELRKVAKDDFEKDLFKLMNNAVFGKTMENIRKHRDIKLVTTDKKRSKLFSEPNYHTMNYMSEDLSIIEMKKTKVKMNKPIYLGLSILEISKILMYEFWYAYMKPKYNDSVKLCYMDADSFIMNIKIEDFYNDIANDVEKRFDTSNYQCDRPLPTGKNKKVIGLMKDELGGRIITEFVTLRPKTYSY